MALRRLRRRNDLFVRGIRAPRTYVFVECVVEEERLLEYERHDVHQPFRSDLPDVDAADPYLALPDVPKARDQVRHGRFSRTRGPDQRRDLSLPCRERNVAQGLRAGRFGFVRVRKTHMAELYVVGRGNPGLGRLGNGAAVENTVDAHYALVDFARASAQVHQFVDGRCYARPHDDEEQPE